MGRTFRGRDDTEAGALSLGYIIVFPAFMLAIMTIIQASFWYLARQTALAAARQGADAARTQNARPGAGPGAALSFARSAGSGYLLQPSASDLGSTAADHPDPGHRPGGVVHPGVNWTVSQVVQAPVEQFTTP